LHSDLRTAGLTIALATKRSPGLPAAGDPLAANAIVGSQAC
jgi:hypothetical protein